IEGTVLILREGTSEEDLCHLFISKEGVHIDGPKIILGRGLADVAGAGDPATPGGEPFVRWSQYRNMHDRLQQEIDELRLALQAQHDHILSTMANIVTTLDSAFKGVIAASYTSIASLAAIGNPNLITTA